MKTLTTICAALVLLGGVAGCGGSKPALAVYIDSDPAVVLHQDDRTVAVRAGLGVTGEVCLDEVSLMTWRV